ncbi:unnamed protein product [Lactuca saligna]|uniref:Transmembrane protein n=1 Tax=Lactuca saligna TaxID=75948 RepID=A0AA35VKA5_LACSI|nr:unnamed protein product [Lactuca saligna]
MTPTHKLLLKQWLEEELILNRIALKEYYSDSSSKRRKSLDRDDCSETFELGFKDNSEKKEGKKPRRWRWKLWGSSTAMEDPTKTTTTLSAENSSFNTTKKPNSETNGKNKRVGGDEFVLERNEVQDIHQITHIVGLLRFYLRGSTSGSCNQSWIPSLCSLLCSLGLIWIFRYKTNTKSHLEKLLEREKEDGKLLGKCVEELKKKVWSFDLLKEVDALRRAKSLRVEGKEVKKWSTRDSVTLFFFTVSCLVLALTRVILCN